MVAVLSGMKNTIGCRFYTEGKVTKNDHGSRKSIILCRFRKIEMNTMLYRIFRYAGHALHSRSAFDLHSPFVFHVYQDILKDTTKYNEYQKVEEVRSAMLERHDFIKMTDLGARSMDIRWNRKIITVRQVARHSSISRKYGQLLFRLVKHLKPDSILELGTSLGISTAYLGLANPEAKIVSIEGCRETAEIAAKNFEHLRLNNITQVVGNFKDMLPELLQKQGKIKMVFIDGNHRMEPTLKYFSLIKEYLAEDAVLILDDIHWSEEMENAWKEIQKHPEVKITIDTFQMGLVFFSDRFSKENFILRF
jgi:predicted O-methyltransferase YrrM